MSDYIKREDAIFVALQQPLYSVVSQIKQLEGIDIVRCRDCRRRKSCVTFEGLANEDGFCSMGVRSER